MINVSKIISNKIILDLNKYMAYDVSKRIIFNNNYNNFLNNQINELNLYKYFSLNVNDRKNYLPKSDS